MNDDRENPYSVVIPPPTKWWHWVVGIGIAGTFFGLVVWSTL